MSATAVIWPIMSALCKGALFIGANAGLWQPVNTQQELFLANHFAQREELKEFSDTELRAWASRDHEKLNKILFEEGFSITLEPFGLDGFGVVSILDVLIKWLHEGTKGELAIDGVTYPAVSLDKAVTALHYGKKEIAQLQTRSADTVWMTIADEPLEGFALLERIKSIKNALTQSDIDYNAIVTFPMVDINQQVDIDWLLGMKLPGFEINQAKQQTKFKMNEKGAHVRSAVAIGLMRSCAKPPKPRTHIIINKPFYIWVERPGLSHPVFAGYITPDSWKEPKDLEGK